MSRKREPWREVILVTVLLIVGIILGVYAFSRKQDDAGATAISVAQQLNVRGFRLEELVKRDNPGAVFEWIALEQHPGEMVRVAVKAVRESGTTEYRFDVDIPGGRVHPANPHARELLEEGTDRRE